MGGGWHACRFETIGELLAGRCRAHRFHDFSISFELKPRRDPVRTWTIRTEHNPRQLVNGLKLFVDLHFLNVDV